MTSSEGWIRDSVSVTEQKSKLRGTEFTWSKNLPIGRVNSDFGTIFPSRILINLCKGSSFVWIWHISQWHLWFTNFSEWVMDPPDEPVLVLVLSPLINISSLAELHLILSIHSLAELTLVFHLLLGVQIVMNVFSRPLPWHAVVLFYDILMKSTSVPNEFRLI